MSNSKNALSGPSTSTAIGCSKSTPANLLMNTPSAPGAALMMSPISPNRLPVMSTTVFRIESAIVDVGPVVDSRSVTDTT